MYDASNGWRPETPFQVGYNFFRSKRRRDLVCAVPEDRPVPAFLDGTWSFAGTWHGGDGAPACFDSAAARVGASLNGFHLFISPARTVAVAERRVRVLPPVFGRPAMAASRRPERANASLRFEPRGRVAGRDGAYA